MAPTKPNADVTVIYRYNNTALVKWGKSTGHTGYGIKLESGGATIGTWVISKALVEKINWCEFDLDLLASAPGKSYVTKYATTYQLTAYGYNANTDEFSAGTTPATLTMCPEPAKFSTSQVGNNLRVTIGNFSYNWTRVIFDVYKKNGVVPVTSFSLYNGGMSSYAVTGLTLNVTYIVKGVTELQVGAAILYSQYYDAIADDGLIYWETKRQHLQGTKPTTFSWVAAKVPDGQYNLTALEWNNYVYKLDEVAAYKGEDFYNLSTVIQYDFVNKEAIADLFLGFVARSMLHGTLFVKLSDVTAVRNAVFVTANSLNLMKDELNAILDQT
ncbi:MAG: hypothetical protein M0R40_00665 [Firmicutes bacterium]|nr:hypothetical protein [Bacillota bacterium]